MGDFKTTSELVVVLLVICFEPNIIGRKMYNQQDYNYSLGDFSDILGFVLMQKKPTRAYKSYIRIIILFVL